MRVGYVLNTFPKLTETFVLNEIIELVKLAHEVKILSIAPPTEEFYHPEVDEYDLKENTCYVRTSENFVAKMKMAFKSLKAPDLWLFKSKSMREKIASVAAANHFLKTVRNTDLDVLHAHFNGVPTLTAMMMSKKMKIPFTFTGHAFDIFKDVDTRSLRERMQTANKVITISYYNRDYLYKITGVCKEKIIVVRACSMLEKFKGLIKEEKANRILSVGRLVEKKGIKYAILAVKEITKEYSDVEYRIVGSGPLENELKNLVKSLGLQKNVTFLGSVTDHELLNEMKYASVFVLPCVRENNGDMDGIPVVLQEAMAAKIPVVSTKLSGIPELVEHEKEGLLVTSRKPKEVADAIRILLEDKILRTRLGEQGKKKVENEFGIRKEVRKLVNVWERIQINKGQWKR